MQEFHLELASQTGKHPPQTVLHFSADPAFLRAPGLLQHRADVEETLKDTVHKTQDIYFR